MSCYFGTRDQGGTKGLWKSLPPVYRQCARCYTDFGSAYQLILQKDTAPNGVKPASLNILIIPFDNVFQYGDEKHFLSLIDAIWYFIHHYSNFPKVMMNYYVE